MSCKSVVNRAIWSGGIAGPCFRAAGSSPEAPDRKSRACHRAGANLGFLFHAQEQTDEARTHFEAALAITRELGNRRLEGNIIGALGRLHQDRGEVEQAGAHYESALAIHREVSDRRSEGSILAYMASLLHRHGSIDAAREALATGEPLLRQLDARLELGKLLCIRAEIERGSGNTAVALTTLSEAEHLAFAIGSGPDSELGRMIAKLRQVLTAKLSHQGRACV